MTIRNPLVIPREVYNASTCDDETFKQFTETLRYMRGIGESPIRLILPIDYDVNQTRAFMERLCLREGMMLSWFYYDRIQLLTPERQVEMLGVNLSQLIAHDVVRDVQHKLRNQLSDVIMSDIHVNPDVPDVTAPLLDQYKLRSDLVAGGYDVTITLIPAYIRGLRPLVLHVSVNTHQLNHRYEEYALVVNQSFVVFEHMLEGQTTSGSQQLSHLFKDYFEQIKSKIKPKQEG
jgi:hypothetical protein